MLYFMIKKLRKENTNIWTNTFLCKNLTETHISVVMFSSAPGHVTLAGIHKSSSTTHFVFSVLSTSTSAGLCSPGVVTHTFIAQETVYFIILPGLDCPSLPLILVTGHDNTKRCSKDFPILHNLPDLHCGEVIQFLLGNIDQ